MTAYTIAARESVREIRESISRMIELASADQLKQDLAVAQRQFMRSWVDDDYEAIELWARLAADIAGLLQQREAK